MIKTTQVAADRAYDKTKTVLPTEVARGVYIENPPGAEALKLMHLLINRAGGRMADNVRHELRMADIKAVDGMRNHSRATLRKLFIELAGAVMVFDDTEAQCEIIGGFLDRANLEYGDEVSNDLVVAWWFGGAFREMAEKSNHWAIMDRQTVFAFSSKYSILLFQHIASLVNLKHVTSQTFAVPELRAILGVSEKKMLRWNDMNRFALKPAIAEINQISRLTLTSTPNKIGRTVASITIAWQEKEPEQKAETRRELNQSKVGRKARREGTVETPALAFPASGTIRFSKPWAELARQHGNGNDIDIIASKFRKSWAPRPLNVKNIEDVFIGFCKNLKPPA